MFWQEGTFFWGEWRRSFFQRILLEGLLVNHVLDSLGTKEVFA
jgi:hypothetical protein